MDFSAITRGDQCRSLLDRSMAIDALDGCGGSGLTVEIAVAMHIGKKMAIDALHASVQMNIFEMDRFGELLRRIRRNNLIIQIQQVAFAVLLENSAENPAVPMIVGELRVLQFRIQLGNLFQEIQIAP